MTAVYELQYFFYRGDRTLVWCVSSVHITHLFYFLRNLPLYSFLLFYRFLAHKKANTKPRPLAIHIALLTLASENRWNSIVITRVERCILSSRMVSRVSTRVSPMPCREETGDVEFTSRIELPSQSSVTIICVMMFHCTDSKLRSYNDVHLLVV